MVLSFSPEDSVWILQQTSSTRFLGTGTKSLLCAAVGLSNQLSSRHVRNIDPMKPPDQRLEQSRMIATCAHMKGAEPCKLTGTFWNLTWYFYRGHLVDNLQA